MNPIAMSVLLLVGLGAFAWTAMRRTQLMRVAQTPANRSAHAAERWNGVFTYVFGQSRMFRYKGAGIAHALIFAGFVVLLLRALILYARGYAPSPHFGFWIFDDGTALGNVYLFLKDVIGVLVIVGVAYFLYLRLGPRPQRMEHTREGVVILLLILGVVLSDMLYEASGYARSAADAASVHSVTPAAGLLALAVGTFPPGVVDALYHAGFWLHAVIVLAFLNLLPYGKHFHVLTVLPNVYFRNLDGVGRLRNLEDIEGRLEREEALGARSAREFTWKDVLDFYTCTECGRCSDNCPATRTGKLLSPKHYLMNLRDHLYRHGARRVGSARQQGAGSSEQGAGGGDGAVAPLVPAVIDPEVLWACTTCGACEQECPVFISYVDKITDQRRHLVMEQGEFPNQLQNAFRGLETVGNPYSSPNEQRAAWAEGLDVPLLKDKPDAEYLYWVGCGPSFDDRSRWIARALAQLMTRAGVDFAILGPEETCNGDPARRAGNEYLFQMLAQQNVETLNNYKVRKIVTTCPHCFQMLGNEYPAFGGRYEVIHHTEFLWRLIRDGRLEPEHEVAGTIVYHDSCYIGRYNDIYDPPREILRAIPGLKVVEAAESRDRGMCCGAGGAQMWKEEEPIRRPNSREGDGKVNHARVRQLLRVLPNSQTGGGGTLPDRGKGGAGILPADPPASESADSPAASGSVGVPSDSRHIATACPFCKTMISDGLTDQGHEDVTQQDVAEVLLHSVVGEPAATTSVPCQESA